MQANDRSTASGDPLPGLQKRLADEFGDVVAAETIGQIARQSLGELRGTKIPDFVPMFALRRARGRLRNLT